MNPLTQAKTENVQSKSGVRCNENNFCDIFNEVYSDSIFYCVSWGQFMVFNGRYYELYDKRKFQGFLIPIVEEYFPKASITSTLLSNIYNFLIIKIKYSVNDIDLAHDYIAFDDCLFNTRTHKKLGFTPEILCFKSVDCSTEDFELPAPHCDKYFKTTLVGFDLEYDPDLFSLYQEMVGSLFSGRKESNKAFFLWGGGANGKSVTTELILSLFDDKFTASASLETLSHRFGKSRLVGKLVNICSEEESQYLKHDVFKALVTGEKIDAERKGEQGFSYHNFAKLMFATNNFPKFSEMDYSTKRRIIIIPFNRQFKTEERDYELLEKLKSEKAQFVWIALQGLKRLQGKNFEFTECEVALDAMESLEEESSSVIRYINLEVVVDKDHESFPVSSLSIYRDYKEWCRDNGFKPFSSAKFAKQLPNSRKLKDHKHKSNEGWKYYIELPHEKLPPVVGDYDLDKIKF